MSVFKIESKKVGLQSVIDNIKNQTSGAPVVTQELSRISVSMEGISSSDTRLGDLESAKNQLHSVLLTSLRDLTATAEMSISQEQAAIIAAFQSGAVKEALAKPVATFAQLSALKNDYTEVMPALSGGMEKRQYSAEAFDEKSNKNVMAFSMVYNALASRQDEFSSAFFPQSIQSPDQLGFSVDVRLVEVISDVRHQVTGAVTDFSRKNIIKALIDSSILRNDITKVTPIVRTGETDAYFAADVGTRSVVVGTETVTTGALAIGKKFSLLGISQTEASVASGLFDSTDSLDPAMSLATIYIKLADNHVLGFAVANIPTAAFNQAIQGNARQVSLNFSTNTLTVTGEKKTTAGAALDGKADIGTHKVVLSAGAVGSVNTQEGTTLINALPVELVRVEDNTGTVIGTGGGAGKTIADLFKDATVIGYDLKAYRTNSNRRNRGQLIDTRTVSYLYPVPVLPPITALRPIGAGDANDAALLNSLISTTQTRASNDAVTRILETRDILKELADTVAKGGVEAELFGAGARLVTPTYLEENIDVETSIDSLKSADRANDVSALLINKIRDLAFRMYQSSGYKAALDVTSGNLGAKTVVIIGTDQTTARYLTLNGDTRLMGDGFDFKIVASQDERMKGKIVVTFGDANSFIDGTPNPLHFGTMAWKPELTLMMPITRNGNIAQELTVQPMYRHVVNLPVMGFIGVTNIEKIIADKVTIKTGP